MGGKVLNFEWSLKPILIWMSLFGIRVKGFEKVSMPLKIVISVQGLIVFLFICIVYGFSMMENFKEWAYFVSNKESERKGQLIRVSIKTYASLVNCLHSLGPHAIFFLLSVLGTLKNLWKNLIEIEEKLNLNRMFYRKARRQCYIGLGVLFLVSYQVLILKDIPCGNWKKYPLIYFKKVF